MAAIVDLSLRWHHVSMRLVAQHLLGRSVLWSLALSCLVFVVLSLSQFMLTERVNYVNSLSHALLFASIYSCTIIMVQWRARMGDIILEGMGVPRWCASVVVSLLPVLLIVVALSLIPSKGIHQEGVDQIRWHSKTNGLVINAEKLENVAQRKVFETIESGIKRRPTWATPISLAMLLPLCLSVGLLFTSRTKETWLPMILSTITFGGMELWVRSYG